MLRKRGKKRVYTLPRINPRAANLNSTDDAQKLGREIQDDDTEIFDYTFNPIPEGEEDRIQVCYDGSDIPDDNTSRNHGTGDRKTNQTPTGQNIIKLPAEQEGHEFGYVPFEQLPPAQVTVTEEVIINEANDMKVKIQHIYPEQKDLKIELPISNLKLKEFQEQDKKINHLRKMWSENKLNKNIFAMENDILKKKVIEGGLLYKPVIIPEILRECLLMLAHDKQGHNGFKRTHSALKTLYYWKGMKRHIQLYCRRCKTCA